MSARTLWLAAPLLAWIASAGAEASAVGTRELARPHAVTEEREPCDDYRPLRQPFFGDTHVHTAYSFDASSQDTRNTPPDAYRFARGESMGIQPYDEQGRPLRTIQLKRPLDFVAVTDHAEMLGEISLCMTPGSPGYEAFLCRIHRGYGGISFRLLAARTLVPKSRRGICGKDGKHCEEAAASIWKAIQDPGSEGAPGTALQRIQIVKGWIEQGEARERVIDVATGGSDADVDIATCERRGSDEPLLGVDRP